MNTDQLGEETECVLGRESDPKLLCEYRPPEPPVLRACCYFFLANEYQGPGFTAEPAWLPLGGHRKAASTS